MSPMFASTELGARIEQAECGFLSECAAAVNRAGATQGAWTLPIAGGLAVYTGPDSPMNKVAGLGFAEPPDEAELEALELGFAERGVPVQVELSCLAEPSLAPLLSRRGYILQGFENVLGLVPTGASPRISDEIEISISPPEEFATWIDVAVSGFGVPDRQGVASHETFPREALERVIGEMASADRLRRYLARRGGVPVGAASMRISEGIAQLTGAATLAEHRGRGVQTTLLAARLADARQGGCDLAVVTTQPGSKSHQNVQRRGFELLYTRAILRLDPRSGAGSPSR